MSMNDPENTQRAFSLTVNVETPLVPQGLWAMPEFLADRLCAKCGHTGVSTVYHQGISNWEPCYAIFDADRNRQGGLNTTHFPEHFDRRCTRCSYKWCEGVIQG